MSTYSTVSWEIKNAIVDVEKIKKFKQLLSSHEKFKGTDFSCMDFHVVGGELLNFYFFRDTGKFYEDDLFAIELSKCLKKGEIRLYFFDDEEGIPRGKNPELQIMYGYRILPNKVIVLAFELKEVEELDGKFP